MKRLSNGKGGDHVIVNMGDLQRDFIHTAFFVNLQDAFRRGFGMFKLVHVQNRRIIFVINGKHIPDLKAAAHADQLILISHPSFKRCTDLILFGKASVHFLTDEFTVRADRQ